jgi:asparagine synthase (glutamine-hydrolysing)
MRGGFVACLGGHGGPIEAAADRLRWHRGKATRYRAGRLEVIALGDTPDGPFVESTPDSLRLVHGAALQPLPDLEATCQRFAALYWDGATLRASRDPMGLAPLFYRIADGALWLASEIHALLGLAPDSPHLAALAGRAAFAPLDEETGWDGILRVLPGCTVEFDSALRRTVRQYWDPASRFGTYRGTRSDALAELRDRFRTAVDRCYEPGCALILSGGQDSAAVAVNVPLAKGKPHAVHVHFPTMPTTHETQYAEGVAGALGVSLSRVPGELHPWDIDAELDMHVVPYLWLPVGVDEPVLAHLERQGIGVALDGHDGDGVLGPNGGAWGSLLLEGALGRLGTLARTYGPLRAARGIVSDFTPPQLRPAGRWSWHTYLQKVLPYFTGGLRSRVEAADIDRWAWPSTRWKTRQIRPLLARAALSFEHKELEAATHGVDLRHPFADRDLVDFLISLPCAIKGDPVRDKSFMMEAMGDALPESIRKRVKSDYIDVVRERVDPALCLEVIRTSGVRLPDIDYARLFRDGDADPRSIPIYLLVNLARSHRFAGRAQ